MLAIERETLLARLDAVPALIDRYQRREPDFPVDVVSWLTANEGDLSRLRSPLGSRCAAERSRLLRVADGGGDPESSPRVGRPKAMRLEAASAVEQIEEALRRRLAEIDATLEPLRDKLAQLLAVVTPTRPIPLPPREPRSEWLAEVWSLLGSVPEARSMHGYVSARLARIDREYLLTDLLANALGGLPG